MSEHPQKNQGKAEKIKKKPTSQKKFSFKAVIIWIKDKKIINKHTVKVLCLLIFVLWLTNPELIPFLPSGIKETLTNITIQLIGDVQSIVEVLPISRVIICKILVMSIFLYLIFEIMKIILENVDISNNRINTFAKLFLSTIHYFFAIIGIIWALKIMGVNTGAIFAGIGIVSLIIGFSAESLIADMITGVFLLFDNQYNVGDYIDVGNFHGEVEKIGFRSTFIRDRGGNLKIINNSNMRDIINRSNQDSLAYCDITVPGNLDIITLEKNLKKMLEKMENKIKDNKTEKERPLFPKEHPEYWGVESVKGNEIVIRIAAWVKEADIYQARRVINREVKILLQKMEEDKTHG